MPPSSRRSLCHHRARCLLAILILALLAAAPTPRSSAQAQAAAPLSGPELIRALRQGGYNLYFRHAATEWQQSDNIQADGDWRSCDPARVRQLSAAGRQTAREVGAAMRTLAVPVAEILSSPYCRTRETAELMGLGPVRTTADVMNLRIADRFGGRDAVIQRARGRLGQAAPAGANRVLVAHGNLGVAATGVYPDEGEGLVFRPLNGQFEFVGRLSPGQWRALAETMR